jgi:DNA-binding protein H-NS
MEDSEARLRLSALERLLQRDRDFAVLRRAQESTAAALVRLSRARAQTCLEQAMKTVIADVGALNRVVSSHQKQTQEQLQIQERSLKAADVRLSQSKQIWGAWAVTCARVFQRYSVMTNSCHCDPSRSGSLKSRTQRQRLSRVEAQLLQVLRLTAELSGFSHHFSLSGDLRRVPRWFRTAQLSRSLLRPREHSGSY